MNTFHISPLDRSLQPDIQAKIDNLNKPLGSLGTLESLALQICLVQQTLSPVLRHPCHLLLGGDHGIEREGVSATPREVTWQQMVNFTRGGGGVNMFCRQHGFHLRIVDMGVDHDLSPFYPAPGRLPAASPSVPASPAPSWLPAVSPSAPASPFPGQLPAVSPSVSASPAPGRLPAASPSASASPVPGWLPAVSPSAPASPLPILNRKIAPGTHNFLHGPAMTDEEFSRAIDAGAALADDCHREGSNIICIGEMGAANTSPSSIWMSLLCDIPLDECIGAGSGLNDEAIVHKRHVLRQALDNFLKWKEESGKRKEAALSYFGGFEMVGAIGAMLRAAELRMLIMVDGFIMTACALAAVHLHPACRDYMIFGHCGDESGHRRMLQFLNAQPLLTLGLRLGEGTGALCAYPIIDSAVRMINEMNNFQDARITKYF